MKFAQNEDIDLVINILKTKIDFLKQNEIYGTDKLIPKINRVIFELEVLKE